eukprot:TRINITY_DN4343_c0_g1_i1.p1 TRINITY_DN4343_c0_g1~~TRINITY_DN4343_c0_g1_i1.p1  ORF type:complete len:608 (+),score=133.74 TRINITY_DN4343_c0_g1_i1:52-1824(+)
MASSTVAEGELPLTLLRREEFQKTLQLQAIRVPAKMCQGLMSLLRGHLFDRPHFRTIILDPQDPQLRLVLLDSTIQGPDLAGLPDPKHAALRERLGQLQIVQHSVELDYSCFSADDVLKEILPPDIEVPSSFETIGHVAHLNLRDELLPYKRIIGQVLLEKNAPRIRTIVNKVGSIENEFRVPELELLAGEDTLETEVKQHGATFLLDYRQVYWNSRLENEHRRLVALFSPGQVICDMFAGIGPFAIPAAKAGCTVHANDLNPDSVRYLRMNTELNQVAASVHAYEMDAREFMRKVTAPPAALDPAMASLDGGLSKPALETVDGREAEGRRVESGSGNGLLEGVAEPRPTLSRGESVIATLSSAEALPGSTSGRLDGARGEPEEDTESLSKDMHMAVRDDTGQVEAGKATTPVRDAAAAAGDAAPTGEAAESRGAADASGGGEPSANGGKESAHPAGEVKRSGGQRKRQRKTAGSAQAVALPTRPATPPWEHFDHAIMNLPASAISFLDVFNGLLSEEHWRGELPMIHVYCFEKPQEDMAGAVIRRAEAALGASIIPPPSVVMVRDVAPSKMMLCVSFRLPATVAFKNGS